MVKNNLKKSTLAGKYTDGGKSRKNGRSRSSKGWSNDGLNRYNELYQLIKKDRIIHGTEFDMNYLTYARNKQNKKNENKKQKKKRNENQVFYPFFFFLFSFFG